jgi:hypothetical protein
MSKAILTIILELEGLNAQDRRFLENQPGIGKGFVILR